MVQGGILEEQGKYLADAAIPIQDLHLTLFVATLHEEDGSLQVLPKKKRTCSASLSCFFGKRWKRYNVRFLEVCTPF